MSFLIITTTGKNYSFQIFSDVMEDIDKYARANNIFDKNDNRDIQERVVSLLSDLTKQMHGQNNIKSKSESFEQAKEDEFTLDTSTTPSTSATSSSSSTSSTSSTSSSSSSSSSSSTLDSDSDSDSDSTESDSESYS